MLMGMLYPDLACRQSFRRLFAGVFVYIHIGVGFGVARFDYQGDARASMCGTSNKLDAHAFLFV